MAVTKALTKATPYEKDSKVEIWELEYTYENDSEGDATYYINKYSERIPAIAIDSTVNFTAKAKATWTKSELEALCPISEWDSLFASQVASVITSPPVQPVADTTFTIPS